MALTWDEIRAKPVGAILHDEYKEGLRFIIMRGPASLCAYAGVPKDHPLACFSYNDFPSINCHGGLTFAREGDKAKGEWPEGFYWYGWDYAHGGDYCFYNDDLPMTFDHSEDKKWLVENVVSDSWEALYDFQRLLKFTEALLKKNCKEDTRA